MNKKLLKNIRDTKTAISLYCNAGVTTVNKIGGIPGYGMVWSYEDSIANILSLKNVKKEGRVTYDNTACDCFEVHKADSTKHVFKPSTKGLFYANLNNDIVLVTTVEYKTNKYTVRKYSNAKKVHEVQNIIDRPSTQDLIKYVEKNLTLNCPVKRQNILRAEDIFGPNIRLLKGKPTCTTQKHVEIKLQDMPQEIMEKHRKVKLAIDMMFINKIPFIIGVVNVLSYVDYFRIFCRKLG